MPNWKPAVSSESDRADEATRNASSAGPAPDAVAEELRARDETIEASVQGEQQQEEPEPSIPAGEPEAPTGPSRPHGDDLKEALPEKGPAEPAESEDHEGKLERDLEELTAKAEKADEYLELAQRTKADFENYRRRAAREAAAAQERGVVKLARELLPAVDNLDRALKAAEEAGDASDNRAATLASGIKLVHADVIAALAR